MHSDAFKVKDFLLSVLVMSKLHLCFILSEVSEVVQTLQLSSDRDPRDVTGDLSVCLDGMQVDPEIFASAERERGKESY